MGEEASREAELEFLETVYGDPFRQATMKAGRNLAIASLLSVAVTKFGATVQSSSLFPISFTQHPDALPTVLTILVGVLTLNFISRVIPDLLRYREVELQIVRYISGCAIEEAREAARAVDAQAESDLQDDWYEPDPWWEEAGKVREKAEAVIAALQKRVGMRKLPRAIRLGRAVGEVAIPLVLAVFAFVEARHSIRW
jgi:hypothetical protein